LAGAEGIRSRGPRAELGPPFARIRALTGRAYLHIDLDVLDVGEAKANELSCPGGLTLSELLEVVGLVRERFLLAAAAITSYDPECDRDGRAVQAAVAVIRELARPSP
jgi:arginase